MGETYSTAPNPVSYFDPISYDPPKLCSGLGSGLGIVFLRIDGDGTGFRGWIEGGGTEVINFGFVSICLFGFYIKAQSSYSQGHVKSFL